MIAGTSYARAMRRTLVPHPDPCWSGQIQAVFFDFGGVLIDSPLDAFARYERDHGLPEGFIRQVNATNHLDNAWARFERSELTFDQFCEQFAAETEAAGARVDVRAVFDLLTGELRAPMVEVLRRVRPYFWTGLLTNNFVVPMARPGHEEVASLFDVVVASADVGVRKPEVRFYELACCRLGVEPSRAVFLDDLGVNLSPARRMGMTTIKVVDQRAAIDELALVVGLPLA